MRSASLTIHKEEFSFSAGHFTIFSATSREQMHGHNYYVSLTFDFGIAENGMSFDYRHYKRKMLTLCDSLDRHFLLPTQSPYLQIEDGGDYWIGHYDHKKLMFLKEDIILVPVTNITIEDLSSWFLSKLMEENQEIEKHHIHRITVDVYNGPGQSGSASWHKQQD